MKRRIAWLSLILVAAVLLVVGSVRESGPLTQTDRIDGISRRIACPTCDGESVYVSRASAAQAIRAEVARQVGGGVRSDDEIVAYIVDRFGGQVLLLPRTTGLDALLWVLPVIAAVVLVGLLWSFLRGRRTIWATLAFTVVVGAAGGVFVANQAGQRLPLQTATGGIENSTASLLSQARLAGASDVGTAIDLYGQVLETDPDNVEALTYRAWLIMLSARQFDDDLRSQAYASTITALGRAIELDPSYPDAMCFLGIVVFRDGGDAASATQFLDRCLANEPPAEVRGLVQGIADEVAAALGSE
jgi:cytochrome c-type biogenesis protein CcmH